MSSSTIMNHITVPRVEQPSGASSMKQHIVSLAQFLAIAVQFSLIVTALDIMVGLPFGPLGVAIGFSATGLLVRLPILYYVAGRRGPVSTADLWVRFFAASAPVDSYVTRDLVDARLGRRAVSADSITDLRARWSSHRGCFYLCI
jgi:hypothetical protein